LNVLIADDNPESLYMLEALFRDSDYRVYNQDIAAFLDGLIDDIDKHGAGAARKGVVKK
jgi:CheY-like chemotaxis protein